MHFMTCLLKHVNATIQAFSRITRSIYSCLVISVFKVDLYISELIEDTTKERDEGK